MQKSSMSLGLIILILLLAACSRATATTLSTIEKSAESDAGLQSPGGGPGMGGGGNGMHGMGAEGSVPDMGGRGGRGMGGIGHGGGMHARHMAAIPVEYAGLRNPIEADEDSLANGETLYLQYCASCHGDGGMGDGPAGAALDPPPSPIAWTSRMMGDDYLFWRISEGGGSAPFNSAMPSWKDALDETARWDVINFLRALGSGEVQPRQGIGGGRFNPIDEVVHRTEMLSQAVAQGIITQEEADSFDGVHAALDDYLAKQPGGFTGRMEDVQTAILVELVETGIITQEQAEVFKAVHDSLQEAGLMP